MTKMKLVERAAQIMNEGQRFPTPAWSLAADGRWRDNQLVELRMSGRAAVTFDHEAGTLTIAPDFPNAGTYPIIAEARASRMTS